MSELSLVRVSGAREGWMSRVDFQLIGAVAALLTLGTLAVLSAASPLPLYPQILHRHFLALGLGTFLFIAGLGLNYQVYEDQVKPLYAFAAFGLLVVLAFGSFQRGSRGWLNLFKVSLQPSELARIITILALAAYLDSVGPKIKRLSYFLGALGVAGPIILLILKQPDLSGTLVLIPVTLAMMFLAGAEVEHLAAVVVLGLLSASLPILWTLIELKPHWAEASRIVRYLGALPHLRTAFWLTLAGIGLFFAFVGWLADQAHFPVNWTALGVAAALVALGLTAGALVDHHLKTYQRKRIEVFLLPETDPKGASYNILQAQIALGSGGVLGRGIFSASQSQLGFLPERHTDFIYAVVGEEMGLWGGLSVLVLYVFIIWRVLEAARVAKDRFGYLVASGLGCMFGFYLLINTGMCLGLVPVAGVQLPMVSYGGSNLVATLWALGIAESIYARRYAFF